MVLPATKFFDIFSKYSTTTIGEESENDCKYQNFRKILYRLHEDRKLSRSSEVTSQIRLTSPIRNLRNAICVRSNIPPSILSPATRGTNILGTRRAHETT